MSGNFLMAIFPGFVKITYENPVTWTCMGFSDCSNWQPTRNVRWSLPNTTYGILYVSDKCNPDGQFHYITDRHNTDDSILLLKERKFRSMMVGEYGVDRAHRPEIKYFKKCSKEVGVVESTVVNTKETSTSENLSSSNWYDGRLPEG